MYRGPNGLKCAIGCLIPDKKYLKRWDKQDKRIEPYKVRDEIFDVLDLFACENILRDLQVLHDVEDVCDWPAGLVELALEYDLHPGAAEITR